MLHKIPPPLHVDPLLPQEVRLRRAAARYSLAARLLERTVSPLVRQSQEQILEGSAALRDSGATCSSTMLSLILGATRSDAATRGAAVGGPENGVGACGAMNRWNIRSEEPDTLQ